MSDPAAKDTREMAQTVHPLDIQTSNFRWLRVMEVSFLSPQSIDFLPDGVHASRTTIIGFTPVVLPKGRSFQNSKRVPRDRCRRMLCRHALFQQARSPSWHRHSWRWHRSDRKSVV